MPCVQSIAGHRVPPFVMSCRSYTAFVWVRCEAVHRMNVRRGDAAPGSAGVRHARRATTLGQSVPATRGVGQSSTTPPPRTGPASIQGFFPRGHFFGPSRELDALRTLDRAETCRCFRHLEKRLSQIDVKPIEERTYYFSLQY